MKGKLILARHQESEWNKVGRWTGSYDRHLTDLGFKTSENIGLLIKDMTIDCAFASMQVRSIETLSCMLNTCGLLEIPTEHSAALNERDYGDYAGRNKWEMERALGEEEFKQLRRGWNHPIPNGESLKMVYDRVIPYFLEHILPKVLEGKNVLVVGHGNSLRTLIKYIESVSDEGIADVEMPFEAVIIYELSTEGHLESKEIRSVEHTTQTSSTAQIVATLGPSSSVYETLKEMVAHQLDVVRFNFSYGAPDDHKDQIALVRRVAKEAGKAIPIIVDLPGPRIQKERLHGYDQKSTSAITEHDRECIAFAVAQRVDYVAVSFVGGPEDVTLCREVIAQHHGAQKVIAKIERAVAVERLSEIIAVSDGVMVARGDLGNEVPIEQIPFVQEKIITLAQDAGKPVIVATQMLLSMVEHPEPTRAEVTDVSTAILQGADAVMLSEETTIGKYPVEAVAVMETIVREAEEHSRKTVQQFHHL